ncbi:hypothetical protein H0H93_007729 [Arthromyces matolae]|nr:hypothetical protein H0H93_007729 [Arthromyces matolae]
MIARVFPAQQVPIPPIYRIVTHFLTALISRAALFILGFYWISVEQIKRKRGFNPIFVLPISEGSTVPSTSVNESGTVTYTPGRRTGTGSANIQSPRKQPTAPIAILGFRPVSLLTMIRMSGRIPPFDFQKDGKPMSLEDIQSKADRPIVVFPECTTSNGRGLLRFARIFRQAVPVKDHLVFVMCVRYDPPTSLTYTPTHSIPSLRFNPLSKLFSTAMSIAPQPISIRLLAPSESPSSPLFIVSEIIKDPITHDDHLGEVCATLISQLGKLKRTGMGWEDKAGFLEYYRQMESRSGTKKTS